MVQAAAPSLHAQVSPISLLDTSFVLLPFGNKDFDFFFDQEGLVFFDAVVQKKTLLYMDVEEVPGILHFSAFKPENGQIHDSVKVAPQSRFIFHFRNGGFRTRYVKVAIKVRLAPYKMTKVVRKDTFYTQGVRYMQTEYVDTVRFSTPFQPAYRKEGVTLLDTRVDLANRLDFTRENGNRFILPVVLPLDEKVSTWAYWIGVGEEAVAYYNKQETQFFEEEPENTATSLLDAYARKDLPGILGVRSGEAIEYAFMDSMRAALFLEGVPLEDLAGTEYRKTWVDYRRIQVEERENAVMYLCLSNPNSVTKVSVFIKILAVIDQVSFDEQPPNSESE